MSDGIYVNAKTQGNKMINVIHISVVLRLWLKI